MRHILNGWMRKIDLTKVSTEIVDFEAKQVERTLSTVGCILPLSNQQLALKPEGQRAWKWMVLFCTTDLELVPDDVVFFRGERFRVTGMADWQDNGYRSQELVNDYSNANSARR
jgi:hypothetical protein